MGVGRQDDMEAGAVGDLQLFQPQQMGAAGRGVDGGRAAAAMKGVGVLEFAAGQLAGLGVGRRHRGHDSGGHFRHCGPHFFGRHRPGGGVRHHFGQGLGHGFGQGVQFAGGQDGYRLVRAGAGGYHRIQRHFRVQGGGGRHGFHYLIVQH